MHRTAPEGLRCVDKDPPPTGADVILHTGHAPAHLKRRVRAFDPALEYRMGHHRCTLWRYARDRSSS